MPVCTYLLLSLWVIDLPYMVRKFISHECKTIKMSNWPIVLNAKHDFMHIRHGKSYKGVQFLNVCRCKWSCLWRHLCYYLWIKMASDEDMFSLEDDECSHLFITQESSGIMETEDEKSGDENDVEMFLG